VTPTQVDIGRNQHGTGRPAWLAPAAAASLRRVDHARGKTTQVNWAGRSEAEQFALVKKYYVRSSWGEFKYDGSWWRKKPGSRVVVAKPTTSPHEPGNALDTDEWTVPGFVALMAEHGWIRTLKSEPWHFVYFASRDKHRNDPPLSGDTAAVAPPKPKEIKVKTYHYQDKDARDAGRTIKPGAGFYLHDKAGLATSQAKNVVGGVGPYSITPHVYATGTPGDVVELTLIWQATKAKPVKNSTHYVERLVVDKDGQIRASREFKRGVAAGDAVFVRIDAPKTNKGPVTVSLLDCDAYLFMVA